MVLARVVLVPVVIVAVSLSGICSRGVSNRVSVLNDVYWTLTTESGVRKAISGPETLQVGAWD